MMSKPFVVKRVLCSLACVIVAIVSLCSLYLRSPSPYSIYWAFREVKQNDTSTRDFGWNASLDVIFTGTTPSAVASENVTHEASATVYVSQTTQGYSSIPNTGYLLPVNIEQQLTGAIYGYRDLATLGSLLKLSTVEPYVSGTNLVGVPSSGSKVMKLGALYDFESFRSVNKRCSPTNDHDITSFVTFLQRASRDVVVVFVLISQGRYKSTFSRDKAKIVEVGKDGGKTAQNMLTKLNKWAAHVSKKKNTAFTVSRVLAMDARPKVALHLGEIIDVLGSVIRERSSTSGSVTVLFDNWRAVHTKPDTSYFYYIPEYHNTCGSIHDISHSPAVIDASRALAKCLNDAETRTRIGVHIRGERLFEKYRQNYGTCIEQLQNLLHNLTQSHNGSQVRVIHDLGNHGSTSCNGFCRSQRPKFLSLIKKLGHRVVSFQPAEFGSVPRNSAFAAFVEREYLSRMDVLVTVGFGGFQNTVIQRFLNRSSDKKQNLHRICS